MTDITAQIAREIYILVSKLTDDPEILSIIGSFSSANRRSGGPLNGEAKT